MWDDEQLKNGLRSGRRDAILQIYEQYHRRIVSWIIRNSGSEPEAEDIFQDALTTVYQKLQDGLKIDHQLYTYLFSICRNLWLKRLRDDRVLRNGDDQELHHLTLEDPVDLTDQQLKEQIFRRKFAQMGKSCQQILKLAFSGKSPKEIADLLSLKSEKQATNRKSYCKQQLAKLVQNDPLYKELKR